jgi:hypothetical protein
MAYSPQNPPPPWPLMAFLADAISGECSDKQARPASSATLNCSAAWPPGHSWPHLARSYLQENDVGVTVVSPTPLGQRGATQRPTGHGVVTFGAIWHVFLGAIWRLIGATSRLMQDHLREVAALGTAWTGRSSDAGRWR